jgi:outer membrane protein assembly factor BamB
MRYGWGTAASPVLHGGRLFIVNDNDEQAELFALDAATGRELWRVDRDEKSNWATPFIWDHGPRTELITPGSRAVRGYDLEGQLLWSFRGMSSIAIPTPVRGGRFALRQLRLRGRQAASALRDPSRAPAATSRSPPGETNNAFIAWSNPVGGPYNPSPLYYEGRVYVLYDRGLVSCYDAKTGKLLYDRERLPKGSPSPPRPGPRTGRCSVSTKTASATCCAPVTPSSCSTPTGWRTTTCAWPHPRWRATACSSAPPPAASIALHRHHRRFGGRKPRAVGHRHRPGPGAPGGC